MLSVSNNYNGIVRNCLADIYFLPPLNIDYNGGCLSC